jgi:hypothetical protein
MPRVFKNEYQNTVIKWEEGKIGTFTMEEILGENGLLTLKIALAGYKAERIRK